MTYPGTEGVYDIVITGPDGSVHHLAIELGGPDAVPDEVAEIETEAILYPSMDEHRIMVRMRALPRRKITLTIRGMEAEIEPGIRARLTQPYTPPPWWRRAYKAVRVRVRVAWLLLHTRKQDDDVD